VIKRSTSYI